MKFAALFALGLFVTSFQALAAAPSSPITIEDIAKTRLTLAGQLIEAYDQNLQCEVEAYPTEINTIILSARYAANPADFNSFMSRIPATSKMRTDLAFLQATGLVDTNDSTQTESNLMAKMTGTKYYAFGEGVYGSPREVTLSKDGIAIVDTLEVLETDPWTKWNTTETTWNVISTVVNGSKRFRVVIDKTTYEINEQFEGGYEIWLEPTDRTEKVDYKRTLSTSPSLCEA